MACAGNGSAGRSADLFGDRYVDRLALRLVFHQPLRQTEGLLRSIANVLGISIAIPDHTTLSRRGGGLTAKANGPIRSRVSGRTGGGASYALAWMLTRVKSSRWS